MSPESSVEQKQLLQDQRAIMKMLSSTAVMCLFILLILAVHTAPAAPEQNNRVKRQITTEKKIFMTNYPNSTDDEFDGCKDQMYNRVTTQLLKKELTSNAKFRLAWKAAKSSLYLGNTWDFTLTREDLRRIALRAYTENTIYRELNNKMHEGRRTYMNKFGLISLHFLITDGIQTRNAQHECRTTYRRTSAAIIIKKDFVRFGSFASSSLKATLGNFGSETCFIINTCFGADISDISAYPDEAEVLIPPYEKFKSKPVTVKPPELSDCNRVYRLRSTGTKSNMKCRLVNKV
ncbi:hypothetical protein MHYP_G00129860 [Metynnis hypsauchen]